ncbi:uncharacterized protein LOC143067325 [Mytilus galloprovincialis]|uniref:uncharacterized protein LOC143067325 n=1 Tax=Mytilus galloprovincialis TaxID=29158 RepID=UPI003F7B7D01
MFLHSYSGLFCTCVIMMAESVARYPNMRRFSANPPSMSVIFKTEPSTSIMSDNYYMMPSNPHDSKDRQYFIMREQQLLSELRNKDDIKRIGGTNPQQKPRVITTSTKGY